ncbi:MAG: GAF domain-containing protein, partial [Rhodothermales bacterium]
MKDDEKTKEQLVNELALMRHRVAELKQTDSQDNRSDEALRMLVEGTASATGDEFFRSLVCNLAHALRVRYAFVSEFAEVTTRVRTLASWVGDGFLGSFEYDLADTPCEKILRGETRHYPEGVQALFPKDTYLVELGAESYLAMPLVDPAGEVLGHLAVIDDKPLPEDPRSTSVFRIFAARAGAELVRKRAEEALRRQAERLRVLRDMDQAILASRSPETIAQAALRHIRRLVPCHRTSVTLFDFETDVFTVLAADVSGGSRVVAGACFPLGTIPDIEAIRQGTVRIVDDILGLAEPSPRLQVLKGEGLRCYVATPLVSQGEVIGALNLGADHPGAFVPEHVDIAGEVADSVAVAIQNARLFEQVHAASERLQNLSRQLVEVQETERRHIARELHDEIGQVLTGLKLTLEMNTRLSNEGLAEAKALANDLIGKVRELSLSLRPAMLDDFGLLA